jgi:hypothetical protein
MLRNTATAVITAKLRIDLAKYAGCFAARGLTVIAAKEDASRSSIERRR